MNSYERVLSAIRGEGYDYTPVVPLIIQNTMEVSGIPHSVYSTDGKAMAESQLAALKMYGYDSVYVSTDNAILAEAMGSSLRFPYDEPPQFVTRCLDGEKIDLTKIARKLDPANDGRMPVILTATEIAKKELSHNVFVKTNFDSGPFSVACALRGEERLFLDLYDDPDAVFDLLAITLTEVIRYGKAIATAGADALAMGDSSAVLIGRQMYEKFAFPSECEVIQALQKETGLPVFLHICGNAMPILDLMGKTGADVLEIDYQCDMHDAFKITGCSTTLEGNVHPTEIMLRGTAEDVYTASVKCIQASSGKRLLLSAGCEIPRKTPVRNVRAMIRASRDNLVSTA
ncbi:MAG: uroporphyrinogen decarboxylase family protein [Treponema sp.]|nr:uroporphyrinogen decarboxylase family protein [Treponema sp.]